MDFSTNSDSLAAFAWQENEKQMQSLERIQARNQMPQMSNSASEPKPQGPASHLMTQDFFFGEKTRGGDLTNLPHHPSHPANHQVHMPQHPSFNFTPPAISSLYAPSDLQSSSYSGPPSALHNQSHQGPHTPLTGTFPSSAFSELSLQSPSTTQPPPGFPFNPPSSQYGLNPNTHPTHLAFGGERANVHSGPSTYGQGSHLWGHQPQSPIHMQHLQDQFTFGQSAVPPFPSQNMPYQFGQGSSASWHPEPTITPRKPPTAPNQYLPGAITNQSHAQPDATAVHSAFTPPQPISPAGLGSNTMSPVSLSSSPSQSSSDGASPSNAKEHNHGTIDPTLAPRKVAPGQWKEFMASMVLTGKPKSDPLDRMPEYLKEFKGVPQFAGNQGNMTDIKRYLNILASWSNKFTRSAIRGYERLQNHCREIRKTNDRLEKDRGDIQQLCDTLQDEDEQTDPPLGHLDIIRGLVIERDQLKTELEKRPPGPGTADEGDRALDEEENESEDEEDAEQGEQPTHRRPVSGPTAHETQARLSRALARRNKEITIQRQAIEQKTRDLNETRKELNHARFLVDKYQMDIQDFVNKINFYETLKGQMQEHSRTREENMNMRRKLDELFKMGVQSQERCKQLIAEKHQMNCDALRFRDGVQRQSQAMEQHLAQLTQQGQALSRENEGLKQQNMQLRGQLENMASMNGFAQPHLAQASLESVDSEKIKSLEEKCRMLEEERTQYIAEKTVLEQAASVHSDAKMELLKKYTDLNDKHMSLLIEHEGSKLNGGGRANVAGAAGNVSGEREAGETMLSLLDFRNLLDEADFRDGLLEYLRSKGQLD